MKNRVIGNATWIIGCKIAQSILALIISMLTARYLGPSNYGLINYASSIVTFVAPVMYLGFNSIVVQEIVSKPNREGEILGTSIFMSCSSAVLCMIGVGTFALIANKGETETLLVCCLYSVILIFQAIDLLQYWFQAKLLSKYTSIVMLVAYVLVSGYKIYLLATEKSIYWFAISNALDYLIIAIGLLFIYYKLGGGKFRINLSLGRYLLSRSKHFILANLMVMIFTQTDKIMIKIMVNDTATGYYSAAVTCAGMTSFVFQAIIDSARPSIFEKVNNDECGFERNMSQLYSVVIYVSLLQSLFMTLLATPIIHILYGNQYDAAIPALQLVVWYTTFAYIGSVRGIWMLAKEQQKYLTVINLIGALSNVVLNAILIPIWGIMGAAVASFITQFFTNVVLGFLIRPIRKNNSLMIKGLSIRMFKDVCIKVLSNFKK